MFNNRNFVKNNLKKEGVVKVCEIHTKSLQTLLKNRFNFLASLTLSILIIAPKILFIMFNVIEILLIKTNIERAKKTLRNGSRRRSICETTNTNKENLVNTSKPQKVRRTTRQSCGTSYQSSS